MNEEIRLLTYNVQSWEVTERRVKGIIDLIKRYDPDILFLQEVTLKWFKIFRKEFKDIYVFTGRDRLYADKNCLKRDKERNCVLFKKDRFNMLWSHTYWLGPDIVHPSKFEGSVFKRIFTVTKLIDLSSGKKIQAISTHFDYLLPEVRKQQAEVLSNYLKKQRNPLVLGGDFNGEPSEDGYKIIIESMFDVGSEFNEISKTYHAYDKEEHMRIDYIFRNKLVHAKQFKLVKEKYEGLPPSDHYPLFSLVEIR